MPQQRRGQTTRIKIVGGELTYSFSDPQLVEWSKPLDHFSTAVRDFSPAFRAFSQYHRRSIMRNFEAEGRPEPWMPLAASTLADRASKGFAPGPILVRSGRMKRSFRFKWGPRSYRVYNLTDYFLKHQYGVPHENLPRRAMVVLLLQDKQQFTEYARRHLMRGFE